MHLATALPVIKSAPAFSSTPSSFIFRFASALSQPASAADGVGRKRAIWRAFARGLEDFSFVFLCHFFFVVDQ
jgi:hypothetical protein